MRLVSILIIVVGYLWVMDHGFTGSYGKVAFLTLGSGVILQELCRAYMEWKYSEQRREYIRVLASAGYILMFLLSFYFTNFFGLA